METFLAHSAKNGYLAQTYEAHIRGVYEKAVKYASEVERNAARAKGKLTKVVHDSAILHDLGKLDGENQKILHARNGKSHHLPVNHVDAGSAVLKSKGKLHAALMVYSHHRGLPDLEAELQRGESIFRDVHLDIRNHTNATLDALFGCHTSVFSPRLSEELQPYDGDQSTFFRMALSCLADADHTDTAIAYGQVPTGKEWPQLRAKERMAALDQYVSGLGDGDVRSRLRNEMYQACRSAEIKGNFSICDSPVGSGKTTAVMAHLLQQAARRNARHIFVVLPYTNIIRQSVDVYRKALVLPGEDPEEVVAELHFRADFQDIETRYLTSLWRAPIIVTTAVAFFETLSSAKPSALRRLHELPGSMVFVDEAHSALPIKLLPLAWRWMNVLADEWNCYWILASGSLVRYWDLECLSEIEIPHPRVDELVNSDLRDQLMEYEHDRIMFRCKKSPVSRQELVRWVQTTPGPRLLIFNTVQSAAVIASDMSNKFGRTHVEHLSTALTPEDRAKVISRVKKRLNNPSDTNWTLVASSCVEAGMDFSFRTGFREISSLLSLLQAAGRVNRHGKFTGAEMWSFSLQDDSMLRKNESLMHSAAVLSNYFEKNVSIVPQLSTRSMNDEIIRDDSCIKTIKQFIEQEKAMQFQTVDREFKVIDENTVPAVVDALLAEAIACGRGNWQLLQKKSVPIRRSRIEQWKLREIMDGVYQWVLGYDDFLGYMYGIINAGETVL